MFKRISRQSILFKAGYLILFSILFFVQLQSKFIASSNEFASFSKQHSTQTLYHHHSDVSDVIKTTFVKVSKRFEVSNTFVVFDTLFVFSTLFVTTLSEFFRKEVPLTDPSGLAFFLRGPPTVSLP